MKHTLAPSALRGLLDATPGAVGCFDANLRTVYANTAFTMTTGVQAGRVLEDGVLAKEVRALLAGSGAPRRVRIASEQGVTLVAVLLAFLAHHPASVVPIVSTTSKMHFLEAALAESVGLSRQQWYEIYQAAKGDAILRGLP